MRAYAGSSEAVYAHRSLPMLSYLKNVYKVTSSCGVAALKVHISLKEAHHTPFRTRMGALD